MVHRIDRGELKKATKLPNGWLRVDGLLTRVGVFSYALPDGKTRRELRLPEEVFDAESLASFDLVPLTDTHPPGFLDAANAREYSRGSISSPAKDGNFVKASILVTDAEVVAKLEAGVRELSCGYSCELDETPGVTADGVRYDSIQRKIRGNHVALVKAGRAGPEARVRMDAGEALDDRADDLLRSQKTPAAPPEAHVFKLKIDGVDFDVPNEAAVQAFARFQKQNADALEAGQKAAAAATAKADALQAKLDSAAAELEARKKELAELPAKLRADATARVGLETVARKVLGAEVKFDGLADDDVRGLVLERLAPKLDLKAKSVDYLRARFDAEIERFDASADEDESDETEVDETEIDRPAEKNDSVAAYERNRKRSSEAYLETLKAHGIA